MEARLLDERGEIVHLPETRDGARVVSRVGEILIRGGTVFAGYSAQDGLLRGDFSSDAFFRTGDVGFWDSLGYSARTRGLLGACTNTPLYLLQSPCATAPKTWY